MVCVRRARYLFCTWMSRAGSWYASGASAAGAWYMPCGLGHPGTVCPCTRTVWCRAVCIRCLLPELPRGNLPGDDGGNRAGRLPLLSRHDLLLSPRRLPVHPLPCHQRGGRGSGRVLREKRVFACGDQHLSGVPGEFVVQWRGEVHGKYGVLRSGGKSSGVLPVQ